MIHREVTPQDLATLRAFCARNGIAHFMQTYLEFSDPEIDGRFELSAEERLAFHRELDRLEGRAAAAQAPGDVRDRVAKREENPLTEAATDRCYKGVTAVKLYSSGDVSFCWSVPPVGNVREQPFLDIWTSDRARQCREFIRDRRCKCNFDCDIYESLELPLSAAERTRRVP